MSLALITITSGATSDSRFLAELLELAYPEVEIHQVNHRLDSGLSLGSEWKSALVARVRGLNPAVVGIGCTMHNAEELPDLCHRLRAALPGAALLLGGSETSMLGAEQWADHGVDQLIGDHPAEALLGWMEALCSPDATRELAPRSTAWAGPTVGEGGGATIGEGGWPTVGESTDPTAVDSADEVVVEPDWGGEVPMWLWRHGALSGPTLLPSEAAARLLEVLQSGRSVKLMAPRLTGRREELSRLLAQLAGQSARRLHLEVLAEHLDLDLVRRLSEAGVARLSIEATALARGAADAGKLSAAMRGLAASSIAPRGDLVYGAPGLGHGDLKRGLDGCIEVGLDEVALRCMRVPWSSGLDASAGAGELRHALAYPREVLSHSRAPFEELLRSRRLAATCELLSAPLAGTGLLRALSGTLGSVADLLEGFAEHLLARGRDPLLRLREAAQSFFHYLRQEHNVDLEQGQGGIKLRRAPLLALRWLPAGRRIITDDGTGRVAHVGERALSILDRFDDARSGREVCEALLAAEPDTSRRELRGQLSRTLEKMISMGFLVPQQGGEEPTEEEEDEAPFTCLEEFDYHYRMLADTARVEAYRRAIQQRVRPGQHVIEIGTGTGILAVLAAQAGARVTTIERYSILGLARKIARHSGVEDRITFVRGRADLVELEKKGDLLLSEIVGNRILNEGLLETTLDARRRLLKRGAPLIPSAIEILAEVGYTDRFEHLQREFGQLGARYGVRLDPLVSWFQRQQGAGRVVWELGSQEQGFTPLAPELSVIRIDLARLRSAGFCVRHTLRPRRGGLANAVALSFSLELQPGINLSTRGGDHDLHWNKPVFMLRTPATLERGKPLQLVVQYEPQGEIAISLEA